MIMTLKHQPRTNRLYVVLVQLSVNVIHTLHVFTVDHSRVNVAKHFQCTAVCVIKNNVVLLFTVCVFLHVGYALINSHRL